MLTAQLVLELGEVLHDGSAVTDVCISHTLHLNRILFNLGVSDGVFGIDSDRLADSVKMRVACTKMNTQFGSLISVVFEHGIDFSVWLNVNLLACQILLDVSHLALVDKENNF